MAVGRRNKESRTASKSSALSWALRAILGVALAAAVVTAGCTWWFSPSAEAAARYERAVSPVDYDNDGVDDYADILAGARADAEARPAYDGGYYEGGYPPSDRGACTDVVWRAFAEAGYDLKAMVDADIARDPESYARVVSKPDPNIDFRRAGVLDVFFGRYAKRLTCEVADSEEWQAGDVVVFEGGRHIGIVSDRRDARGTAFLIHNSGQPSREEDYLAYPFCMSVTGHYRWDASCVPATVLGRWEGASS